MRRHKMLSGVLLILILVFVSVGNWSRTPPHAFMSGMRPWLVKVDGSRSSTADFSLAIYLGDDQVGSVRERASQELGKPRGVEVFSAGGSEEVTVWSVRDLRAAIATPGNYPPLPPSAQTAVIVKRVPATGDDRLRSWLYRLLWNTHN